MKELNILVYSLFVLMLVACSSLRSNVSDAESRADAILGRLDKNEDRKISKSEIRFPMTEEIFEAQDSNSDDFLDRAEIIAYIESRQ